MILAGDEVIGGCVDHGLPMLSQGGEYKGQRRDSRVGKVYHLGLLYQAVEIEGERARALSSFVLSGSKCRRKCRQ